MVNTIVLYEGKYGTADQVARNIGMIIGNTKAVAIQEAPKSLAAFQNVVFVFSFRGYDTLSMTKPYLQEMQLELAKKQVVVIGVGLAKSDLKNYMVVINEIIPVQEEMTYFVQGKLHLRKLTKEDYETLEVFTKQVKIPFKDMGGLDLSKVAEIGVSLKGKLQVNEKPMPKEALQGKLEIFIKDHNMLALTTGSGEDVRCSPVEYIYNEENFYIITEGGVKFRGLTQNQKVSFGIYDPYKGMSQLGGLQVTAIAQMVPLRNAEYMQIMTIRGIKPEALQKLPIDLYMVKLIPSQYEFLCSELKQEGYDAKQILKVVEK